MYQMTKKIVTLVLKVTLLAALTLPTSVDAQRKSTSVNVNSSSGKTTISIKNGFGNNFNIEYKGDIVLSDDDTDVVSISRGGYMEIKKSAFGNRRRILIEPDDSGRLIKKYYVGGSQKSFDAEGKKWLSEILLEVVRTTTLGAEKRVDRMYRKGGANKVLNEVDHMSSDHVKSVYLKLLSKKDLNSKDWIALLNTVSEIESDYHKADILKHNALAILSSSEATAAYIRVCGKIESDHHKADVLLKCIQDAKISDTQMKTLFTITEAIDSDHHKARVLLEVLQKRSLTPQNSKLLVQTSKSIDSDHHKASVLKKALHRHGLSDSGYHVLLASVANMDSDYHIASIFIEMAKKKLDAESLAHLLNLVETNMDSDSHKANVLKTILDKQMLSDNALNEFVNAVEDIDSDHHKSDVIKKMVAQQLNDNQLISVLKAVGSIDSDYHRATSLIGLAPMVRSGSKAVQEAYREACRGISSDSHFRRALNALD